MEEMSQERDLECQRDQCCGLGWLGLERAEAWDGHRDCR